MGFFENVFSRFPCGDYDDVRQVLNFAVDYCTSQNNGCFTVEHVVYGCMVYVEENVCFRDRQEWFVHPVLYVKKSGLCEMELMRRELFGQAKIQNDIKTLSNVYKDIVLKYPDSINYNALYSLIAYLEENGKFSIMHEVPSFHKLSQKSMFFTDFLDKKLGINSRKIKCSKYD